MQSVDTLLTRFQALRGEGLAVATLTYWKLPASKSPANKKTIRDTPLPRHCQEADTSKASTPKPDGIDI